MSRTMKSLKRTRFPKPYKRGRLDPRLYKK